MYKPLKDTRLAFLRVVATGSGESNEYKQTVLMDSSLCVNSVVVFWLCGEQVIKMVLKLSLLVATVSSHYSCSGELTAILLSPLRVGHALVNLESTYHSHQLDIISTACCH